MLVKVSNINVTLATEAFLSTPNLTRSDNLKCESKIVKVRKLLLRAISNWLCSSINFEKPGKWV